MPTLPHVILLGFYVIFTHFVSLSAIMMIIIIIIIIIIMIIIIVIIIIIADLMTILI